MLQYSKILCYPIEKVLKSEWLGNSQLLGGK